MPKKKRKKKGVRVPIVTAATAGKGRKPSLAVKIALKRPKMTAAQRRLLSAPKKQPSPFDAGAKTLGVTPVKRRKKQIKKAVRKIRKRIKR